MATNINSKTHQEAIAGARKCVRRATRERVLEKCTQLRARLQICIAFFVCVVVQLSVVVRAVHAPICSRYSIGCVVQCSLIVRLRLDANVRRLCRK